MSIFENSLNEKCGVFGISGSEGIVQHCLLGLHALQHRGQESFGIAVFQKGNTCKTYHASGYVNQTFRKDTPVKDFNGTTAVGHVRYSTSGEKIGAQPFILESKYGIIAVAHNGNLVNYEKTRQDLIDGGCIFESLIDTEVFAKIISTSSENTLKEAVIEAVKKVDGAYSIVVANEEVLIGLRDPLGMRPLSIGKIGDCIVISSETCGLDAIGASLVREIEPGEVFVFNFRNKCSSQSYFPFKRTQSRFCIFEYVYFARPSSTFNARSVYNVRKNIGKQLFFAEQDKNARYDIVVPVPDSGIPAALGYSEESKIPFEFGIIRNNYTGRTFLQPTQSTRELAVNMKYSINKDTLEGKSIILIDDSIVRGTTLKGVVAMLRLANVKEIHLRISSPPTIFPCFYGIDTPIQESLLAYRMSLDEMRTFMGVNSLSFININGLYRAIISEDRNNVAPQYCDACFTGEYPVNKA